MRKYRGPDPNIIQEAIVIADRRLVTTRNGAKYFLSGEATLGEDVFKHKFTRAHPQTFAQDVNTFHRILDGYPVPFATYVRTLKFPVEVDRLETWARRSFIEDMAKQDVVVRFT